MKYFNCHLHYSVPFKKIQNVNQVFQRYMYALRTYFFHGLDLYLHLKYMSIKKVSL